LIAEVDCTKESTLCIESGVGIYPTLSLYKDGWRQEVYSEQRTALYLKQFVWDKLSGESALEPNSVGIYRPDAFTSMGNFPLPSVQLFFGYHLKYDG
jgi:hypothetical protein